MADIGLYKCDVCGNVISVVEAHQGELVCCNQPMNKLEPKTVAQEGKEKHVPVLEKTDNGVRVRVGSVPHPMEDKHWIVLIQIARDGIPIECKRLYPGDEPVAEFIVDDIEGLTAMEYCNLHGLWKS